MIEERFSQPARGVVSAASRIAQEFGHDHVGSEHLLLALTRNANDLAARALALVGVAPAVISNALEHVEPRATPSPKVPSFDDGARRVLERALELSFMDSAFIRTEHILIAISRETSGPIPAMLATLRVNEAAVTAAITQARSGTDDGLSAQN
jgi:ATP-dependent Clp protease ATP-binding subunit ClpC